MIEVKSCTNSSAQNVILHVYKETENQVYCILSPATIFRLVEGRDHDHSCAGD